MGLRHTVGKAEFDVTPVGGFNSANRLHEILPMLDGITCSSLAGIAVSYDHQTKTGSGASVVLRMVLTEEVGLEPLQRFAANVKEILAQRDAARGNAGLPQPCVGP